MSKLIKIVVVLVILAAIGGGYAWAWKTRETKTMQRNERRAVMKEFRALKADAILPYLEKLASEKKFRAVEKPSFPYLSLGFRTRVEAEFIGQLAENAIIRFAGNGTEGSEDVKGLKAMLDFSHKMLASGDLPSDAADMLKTRMLDAYFLSKDYDSAVAAIQAGIPGKSPEWAAGTIAKLRAHKAVDAGDKKEAVKQFLEFGKFLESKEMENFEDCDPTTGIIYSLEWVRARNFARCAKYSRESGDAAAAEGYKAKAAELFKKAFEKVSKDNDPKSIEVLKAEMKAEGL